MSAADVAVEAVVLERLRASKRKATYVYYVCYKN
jgi:hypothetical protein